jgi:hypothetical protein
MPADGSFRPLTMSSIRMPGTYGARDAYALQQVVPLLGPPEEEGRTCEEEQDECGNRPEPAPPAGSPPKVLAVRLHPVAYSPLLEDIRVRGPVVMWIVYSLCLSFCVKGRKRLSILKTTNKAGSGKSRSDVNI